jgi:protein-S-isoprenylcysteine O-methyltransferase Ste14
MVERAFVWIGGALFVGALAFCTWWYLVPLGRAMPARGARALVTDAGLITMFALHHSVFARDRIKQRIARVIPDRLVRSFYVWTASALLIVVCLVWRPLGGTVYFVDTPASLLFVAVQLAGLWLIAQSVRAIDALELAGIRRGAGASPSDALQIEGPYGLVRHPVYLGWMLAVFAHPHMTGDRFAFALLTSAYLVIAIPWEERSLRDAFGGAYERYQDQVRWRVIPFLY